MQDRTAAIEVHLIRKDCSVYDYTAGREMPGIVLVFIEYFLWDIWNGSKLKW